MGLIVTVIAIYVLCMICWVFYLAVMNLAENRAKLRPVAKAHAYLLLGIGLILDMVVNVVLSALVFVDRPRALLFTGTLKYHADVPAPTWRSRAALWLCRNLLDPFDPKGKHC